MPAFTWWYPGNVLKHQNIDWFAWNFAFSREGRPKINKYVTVTLNLFTNSWPKAWEGGCLPLWSRWRWNTWVFLHSPYWPITPQKKIKWPPIGNYWRKLASQYLIWKLIPQSFQGTCEKCQDFENCGSQPLQRNLIQNLGWKLRFRPTLNPEELDPKLLC